MSHIIADSPIECRWENWDFVAWMSDKLDLKKQSFSKRKIAPTLQLAWKNVSLVTVSVDVHWSLLNWNFECDCFFLNDGQVIKTLLIKIDSFFIFVGFCIMHHQSFSTYQFSHFAIIVYATVTVVLV